MTNLLFQSRPVTWLEVTRDHIFVSEGPGLSVYTTQGHEKVCQKLVFPHSTTIQGFSVWSAKEEDVIFLYGRNHWTLISFNPSKRTISTSLLTSDTNKISNLTGNTTYVAARWLNTGSKLAAITDENFVHIFTGAGESNGSRKVERSVMRGVPTTLFSAAVIGDTADNLVVFSGTNLSQIYVWAPFDLSKTYHLLIEGIKGSVLSLKYGVENQILVASSDQRSVLAWKFCTKNSLPLNVALEKNVVSVNLVSEMIGHTGRVWDVDISGNYIVSAGQDSNLLLWDISGRLLKVFSGQSVVSLRASKFTWDAKSVICGADDSSVTVRRVADNASVDTVKFLGLSGCSDGYPKQVLCLGTSKYLVALSSGSLVVFEINGNTYEVFSDLELSSYNICAFSLDRKYIAVGSKTGLVFLLRIFESESVKLEKVQVLSLDSKIVSLNWLNSTSFVVGTCITAYFVELCDKVTTPEEPCGLWIVKSQFVINWKDKPGVAGAIILKTTCEENVLVLGDEWGHLHSFRFECNTPVFTLPKVHGSYGVCDLTYGKFRDEFWSVGRNRCIMNLKLKSEPLSLVCIQTIDSGLNWNSRLIATADGSFLCGFSENDFVIVDLSQDYIVKKFPCGGAHRSWDVAFGDYISFAFIRHKEVTVAKLDFDSHSLKSGIFGGKTINAISICPDVTRSGSRPESFCLLTAGEDCALRLASVSVAENVKQRWSVGAKKLAKFKGHASSVRVIKWKSISDSSILVLSGGGRSQVIASVILAVEENLVWSKKASISLQNVTGTGHLSELDMRVMDISLIGSENSVIQMLCACSDGLMRLLELKEKFAVMRTFSHCEDSVLKSAIVHSLSCVSWLPCATFWATSNGELAFTANYDTSNSGETFYQRVNEAAITAMTVVSSFQDSIVITGGDNGVIKTFKLKRAEKNGRIVWSFDVLHEDTLYHHAAINAVQAENGLVFAASADQVVTVRSLSGSQVKKFSCGVSDIQDLAVTTVSEGLFLLVVVGQGLEVLNFNATEFGN